MKEKWMPVPGYRTLYEASDLGRIRRRRDKFTLKATENKYGYLMIGLTKNKKRKTKTVHKIVLNSFGFYRRSGQHARHLNCNKKDNRLINLKYGSPRQNYFDGVRNGIVRIQKWVKMLDKIQFFEG